MQDEVDRALEQLRPGDVVDLYDWTRRVALRVAMRALFGVDPDRARAGGLNAAERVRVGAVVLRARLSAADPARAAHPVRAHDARSRGGWTRSSTRRSTAAARQRRARGGHPLDAARRLPTRTARSLDRAQIRDEVMTLLFAGHDTTTSTVAFMFYELARNPRCWTIPSASVEMILDETLRKYPPAYIGPRRSVEAFEFNGATRAGARPRALLLVGQPPPAATCGPSRSASARSASARRTRRSCRWAPTCRSAAARAPASGCASARPRSRVIARCDPGALPARAASPATSWRSATRRRSRRGKGCR